MMITTDGSTGVSNDEWIVKDPFSCFSIIDDGRRG
jgi:hypothetical protein